MHSMRQNAGQYLQQYIVLTTLREQLLNIGHGTLRKVMESHGISKVQKD